MTRLKLPKTVRANVLAGVEACDACGATEDLVVDHIIPGSKGGTNDPENLQVLCSTCNSRKGWFDAKPFQIINEINRGGWTSRGNDLREVAEFLESIGATGPKVLWRLDLLVASGFITERIYAK